MPAVVLDQWRHERQEIERRVKEQGRELTEHEKHELERLYSDRVEEYLDRGIGDCWLNNPEVAELVVGALKYFDGSRYHLFAWCVMPNHAHVVFSPVPAPGKFSSELIPILHSWKSYTSHKANEILRKTGKFWQEEYYDHRIRTEKEFWFYVRYTLNNPVVAGLCKKWTEWPWSGCSEEIKVLIDGMEGL
jgi:REP element-mobilizing transposase RayT